MFCILVIVRIQSTDSMILYKWPCLATQKHSVQAISLLFDKQACPAWTACVDHGLHIDIVVWLADRLRNELTSQDLHRVCRVSHLRTLVCAIMVGMVHLHCIKIMATCLMDHFHDLYNIMTRHRWLERSGASQQGRWLWWRGHWRHVKRGRY